MSVQQGRADDAQATGCFALTVWRGLSILVLKEFLIETKPRKAFNIALTLVKLPGVTDAFTKQVSERNAIVYTVVYLSCFFCSWLWVRVQLSSFYNP